MPDPIVDDAAWAQALSDLEAALGAAASGGDAVWTPPTGLGPIPAHLVDRARMLQAGQQELIAELENARRETSAHLAALRSIPATRPEQASVYLDIAT